MFKKEVVVVPDTTFRSDAVWCDRNQITNRGMVIIGKHRFKDAFGLERTTCSYCAKTKEETERRPYKAVTVIPPTSMRPIPAPPRYVPKDGAKEMKKKKRVSVEAEEAA